VAVRVAVVLVAVEVVAVLELEQGLLLLPAHRTQLLLALVQPEGLILTELTELILQSAPLLRFRLLVEVAVVGLLVVLVPLEQMVVQVVALHIP
jgi:hypothetical protein